MDKIVYQCRCGCSRKLVIRQNDLWLVDTLLKFQEKVEVVGDFINNKHSLSPAGMLIAEETFAKLKRSSLN